MHNKDDKNQTNEMEAIAKPFPSPNGTFDFSAKKSSKNTNIKSESNAAPTVITITTGRGETICVRIPEAPIMLVNGNPSDRTYFIDGVLRSLFLSCSAEELKALVFDMSGNFREFNGVPHMAADVIESQGEMPAALKAVSAEIERRRELLKRVGVGNLEDYNETAEQKLPRVLVILGVGAQDLAREELLKFAPASDVGFYFIVTAAWRLMPELSDIAPFRALYQVNRYDDGSDMLTLYDADGRYKEYRAEFAAVRGSIDSLKDDYI